jgi:hypothetical protein
VLSSEQPLTGQQRPIEGATAHRFGQTSVSRR